jgi:hypothetical protein
MSLLSKVNERDPKFAKELERRQNSRVNSNTTVQLNIPDSKLQNKSLITKTVQVRRFPGLENSNRLSPENRQLKEKISRSEPHIANKLKTELALKHLEEQRQKGHMVKTEHGEIKGTNFEPHELPEVNSILYNFHYDSKHPVVNM